MGREGERDDVALRPEGGELQGGASCRFVKVAAGDCVQEAPGAVWQDCGDWRGGEEEAEREWV